MCTGIAATGTTRTAIVTIAARTTGRPRHGLGKLRLVRERLVRERAPRRARPRIGRGRMRGATPQLPAPTRGIGSAASHGFDFPVKRASGRVRLGSARTICASGSASAHWNESESVAIGIIVAGSSSKRKKARGPGQTCNGLDPSFCCPAPRVNALSRYRPRRVHEGSTIRGDTQLDVQRDG